MNETIGRPGKISLAICLILMLSAVALSQNKASATAETDRSSSTISAEERADFYNLTKMTADALAAGESANAKTYAERLLKQSERFHDDWNYGNAVQVGNLVLGFIALDSDDLDKAKGFLLAAGETPGSPQLNTFGPDMLLAKELLEREESETVLVYFELCAKFWKMHDGRLELWKEAVKRKEIPDFGANLVYQLGELSRVRQNKKN